MKRKIFNILCTFMLFASLLSVKLVPVEVNASEKTSVKSYSNHSNFISISVIIDKNQDFDAHFLGARRGSSR